MTKTDILTPSKQAQTVEVKTYFMKLCSKKKTERKRGNGVKMGMEMAEEMTLIVCLDRFQKICSLKFHHSVKNLG